MSISMLKVEAPLRGKAKKKVAQKNNQNVLFYCEFRGQPNVELVGCKRTKLNRTIT